MAGEHSFPLYLISSFPSSLPLPISFSLSFLLFFAHFSLFTSLSLSLSLFLSLRKKPEINFILMFYACLSLPPLSVSLSLSLSLSDFVQGQEGRERKKRILSPGEVTGQIFLIGNVYRYQMGKGE